VAGIREKKKLRTHDAIVNAAFKLMLQKGFVETTIDEIAEKAEVGVGTIYNYFGSKRAVLLVINEKMTEDMLLKGEEIKSKAEGTPEKVIFDLIWLYFSEFFVYDRSFMREIMASVMTEYDSIAKEMLGLDLRLVGQVAGLLEQFQDRGVIRRSIPIDRASLLLYGTMMMPWFMFLFMEDLKPETLKMEIEENIKLIFMDWKESEAE